MAVVANCARSGFDCVAEQHLVRSVNFSFSEVEPEQIRQRTREVAETGPQCLTTFCTNLRAAQLAPALEAELGIPVYDTVSTAVWKALRLCGIDTRRVLGWAGAVCSERKSHEHRPAARRCSLPLAGTGLSAQGAPMGFGRPDHAALSRLVARFSSRTSPATSTASSCRPGPR